MPYLTELWPLPPPALQYVNFGYCPQRLQILTANVVGLGWSVFLSWMANKQHHAPPPSSRAGLVATAVPPRLKRRARQRKGQPSNVFCAWACDLTRAQAPAPRAR